MEKTTDKDGLYPPPEESQVKRRLTEKATDTQGLYPPPKEKEATRRLTQTSY